MMASEQSESEKVLNNAFAMNVIQNKLNELVGKPSGYINSFPVEVKKRINALKNLQKSQAALEFNFRKELLELEKKYAGLAQPFTTKRFEIIQGQVEPTEEDCKVDDEPEEGHIEEIGEDVAKVTGIPDFWLQVLRGNQFTESLITEEDEPALSHLIDIRLVYLDNQPGYKIEFHFSENEYFTNSVLTKSFYLSEGEEDFEFEKSEGCDINWKEGKNLTVQVVKKTQRKPGTNKTRTLHKTVDKDSFFQFFNTLSVEDAEDDEEGQDRLEAEFEIGEEFKTKIINHAILYFTGEIFEDEYDDEDYDEEEEDDEEGDDEDEDEEEEDEDYEQEEKPKGKKKGGKMPHGVSAQAPQECKQQ